MNNFKNKILNGYDMNGNLLINKGCKDIRANNSPLITINVENKHVYKKPQQINGGKTVSPFKECSRNKNLGKNDVRHNMNNSVDISQERNYCRVESDDKGIIRGYNCQTVCNTKTVGDNEDDDFFCDVKQNIKGKKFRNISC